MNAREMRLLVGLLGMLGLGGAGILVYSWFYKPLLGYNVAIRKLNDTIEQKQVLLDTTLDERSKLLARARLMSLSPSMDLARSEYHKYLYPLLESCQFDIESFSLAPSTELKGTASVPGGTALKPGHQVVAFQVKAKAEIEGLVKALDLIQKTPLIHRIKLLTIDRDTAAKKASDKLTIAMTIEAMIVSKAEAHSDGPFAPDLRLIMLDTMSALYRGPTALALIPWIVGPTGPLAQDRVAAESGYRRDYADVAKKNIFNGLVPYRIPIEPKTEEPYDPAPDFDPRDYIRLDTTDPDGREAYLRNLVYKTPPTKLRMGKWSGYDTFRIFSEYKTKVLVKGKVLRIDQRDVYFQVREEIYGIHIGQSLWEAMKRPLSDREIEALNLTSQFDAAWGEAEQKEYLAELAKDRKKRQR
jgi:hypothetical protein